MKTFVTQGKEMPNAEDDSLTTDEIERIVTTGDEKDFDALVEWVLAEKDRVETLLFADPYQSPPDQER